MRTCLFLLLSLVMVGGGCVAPTLERHAVSQIQTVTDFRYQAALRCLATVAADPGNVPSYALLSNGSSIMQDTGVASTGTNWALAPLTVFKSEVLGFTGTHAPQAQWTVDPVTDHSQLKALRAACDWVLRGQDLSTLPSISILADPEDPCWSMVTTDPDGETPAPHFGVARRLAQLPRNWLCLGRPCNVPGGACYSEQCGEAAVWVTRNGLEGLAQFTLVLQDIATLLVAPTDGSRPANITPPKLVTLWEVQNTTADTVDIDIKSENDKVVFRQEGISPKLTATVVIIGQSVTWHNYDRKAHTIVVSDKSDKFHVETRKIEAYSGSGPAPSDSILFDQTTYQKLSGTSATNAPAFAAMSDTIGVIEPQTVVLTPPDPLYSPTLVYRDDRVIKPQCVWEIEHRIQAALAANESQPVAIEMKDGWINTYTTQYQGDRTGVKPGSSTQKPVTPRPKPAPRVLTGEVVNAWGVRRGPIFPVGPPMQPPIIKHPPEPIPTPPPAGGSGGT